MMSKPFAKRIQSKFSPRTENVSFQPYILRITHDIMMALGLTVRVCAIEKLMLMLMLKHTLKCTKYTVFRKNNHFCFLA